MEKQPLPRNRRRTFSLLTLFVVILIAGVFLAWFSRQRQWAKDRDAYLHGTGEAWGFVVKPPFPLALLGAPQGFEFVRLLPEATDEELARGRQLFPGSEVYRDTVPSRDTVNGKRVRPPASASDPTKHFPDP